MTDADILARLERMIADSTQAAIAEQLGISAPYLSDIRQGRRRIARAVLQAMGLEREVTVRYRKVGK